MGVAGAAELPGAPGLQVQGGGPGAGGIGGVDRAQADHDGSGGEL